jgi:hypothetical protein
MSKRAKNSKMKTKTIYGRNFMKGKVKQAEDGKFIVLLRCCLFAGYEWETFGAYATAEECGRESCASLGRRQLRRP